ncbi:putative bifunctional UDP-N-acetylglucosamine transferase and deubiquitinase ALG13 isoform X3 [Gadus macrocephalus]|uniref:putative bifunctional UDP-N-acetylglucosamine transferase and deubiquitinase ALG13 isoform X3 n=1 Tax=Gadus macrocephalus TaxID=80720 RepID=UPI0028CB891F|nr:putative bifunctional UDP-N-acetylglucosamine transferase and deubiquitinase ALG13 isoform X3 [Gadus macrocephalus]
MQKGLKKYFVNMDEYLASLGLYRKMLARDASCLFRAVSEQLYCSQHHHQKIRRECANFMRANRCKFEPFVQGSFEKYLERLEDPKETAGQVEIKALSLLYRRCFWIYRFPGKAATVITEEEFVDKVILCCSNNGHYDIVYPRQYPAIAALCQSMLYELLYTRVFGVEEADLCQALEAFRVGGRRYRNSPSACSDGDLGYDTPEDPPHREDWDLGGSGGPAEDKTRATEDGKGTEQAGPGGRLALPYKVLKSLDTELYRNLEFDVWHDTRKEMQKTDYMVFAGRQYFLGDKCQVRLELKGKYYNAFIQEVGTHSSAVTVFIEELGEKHLVPLANLKPVNPVPAWNVVTTRKGDLDGESRTQRHHRHRYFRKSRGGGKGAELLVVTSSYGGRPSSQTTLPPRFQPSAPPRPGLHPPPSSPGGMTYDPYAPHTARPPRYGAPRSSTRFLNRHLIGPQLAYYHPGRRYYHGYDNYAFRSRRSRRSQMMSSINKDGQFGFPEGEEEQDGTITYYQLETGSEDMFPPLPGQTAPPPMMGAPTPPTSSPYWAQRGPMPAPPPAKHHGTSSEDDQEDTSTVEDQEYTEEYLYGAQESGFQSPGVYTGPESTANMSLQEGNHADSPPDTLTNYTFTHQVVKSAVISSPSSSSSSSSSHTSPASHLPSQGHTHTVAMAIPAASQWLVNELGEPLSPLLSPPPYSYDPNGNDLPRDCRVLQHYFNLGVQWYHQSCWQQAYTPPPDTTYHYQTYPSHYLSHVHNQEPRPMHECDGSGLVPAGVQSAGTQPVAPYPESTRNTGDPQADQHSGPTLSHDGSTPLSPVTPAPPLLYQDHNPPPLLPLPYEATPPSYVSVPPTPHPSYHQYPISWAPGPRLYCAAPTASHLVGYVTTPPHQQYIPHI